AESLGKDIEAKLKKAGVRTLEEKIGHIVKRGDSGPVRTMETLQPLRLDLDEIARRTEPRPGGVFIEMHTVPKFEQMGGERWERMGGERATRLGGVWETLHQVPERKGGVYIERHISGGESIRRLDFDFKKTLEALKKDPKFLEEW